MMRLILPLLLALALGGCQHETAEAKRLLAGREPVIAGTLVGDWLVVDLNGGGVPAGAPALRFAADTVSGRAGCNRISGPWRLTGARLSIGPLAATRMGCDPARMDTETKLLGLLAAVDTLAFDAAGQASLAAPDGRRLLLRRPARPVQAE